MDLPLSGLQEKRLIAKIRRWEKNFYCSAKKGAGQIGGNWRRLEISGDELIGCSRKGVGFIGRGEKGGCFDCLGVFNIATAALRSGTAIVEMKKELCSGTACKVVPAGPAAETGLCEKAVCEKAKSNNQNPNRTEPNISHPFFLHQ